MERQEVSEGGGIAAECPAVDVHKLGTGPQIAKGDSPAGDSQADGEKPRVKRKRVRVFTEEQKAYWKQWHKDYYQRVAKFKKQVLNPQQKERKLAWTRKYMQDEARKAINRQKALDYYHKNKEAVLAKKKAIRDSIPNFNQAIYQKDKEKHLQRTRKWASENKEKLKVIHKAYLPRRRELCKLRRAENPARRLAENLRGRIYMLVRRNSPHIRHRTYDTLGCTPDFFRSFLEAQFKPEMNWDNYGTYWTIDHIIPVSSFDLTDPAEVKKAFHYSNCRPLESELNSEKNDSLPGPHQALLV